MFFDGVSPFIAAVALVLRTFRALIFASVSAGVNHTCGVTTTGTPLCWGSNGQERLGDGTTETRHTPTPVSYW